MNQSTLPPMTQPQGGWLLKLPETSGTVEGETFDLFVKAANEQLAANGFEPLSSIEWLKKFVPC